MAGLMQFDYFGDAQRAGERAAENKRVSGLRALAGDYYGQLDPTAGKVAALGGDAGGMLRDRQGMQEVAQKEAGRIAGLIVAAPSQMRPGLYAAHRQKLAQIGLQGLPEAWSDDLLPVAQQMAGGGDAYKPMNVSPGGQIVDPRTGKVIHSNENFAPQKPIWDSARGGFVMPPGAGGQQGAPVAAGGGFMPVTAPKPDYEAQRLQIAQEANARAAQAAADAAEVRRRQTFGPAPQGQRFRDDGTLEPIPGYTPPISATERKDMLARRTKAPQVRNVLRGLDRIDSALKQLDMPGVNTGPLDQFIVGRMPAGQELEAATGGIQNSLLALTRVPGIGSQSDLEARIAALQYPSLNNPPEVNRRTMDQLRAFVNDLKEAYDVAMESDKQYSPGIPSAPSAAPASAPRAVNPQTGEVMEFRNGKWTKVAR
jgi:hypothetical protein